MRKWYIFLAVWLFSFPCILQAEPINKNVVTDFVGVQSSEGLLSDNAQEAFKNLKTDPDPEQLVMNSHYWISNENAHYVWYKHVKDIGGVFSGVGTDQVYLIAGWMNAELVIPMDFDRAISNLHFAYGAAFMASENIDTFLSYWKSSSKKKMHSALKLYFPEYADDAMKSWNLAQKEVSARLRKILRKYSGISHDKNNRAAGIPTFVTDEEQYRRIRKLWINQRVYPICGDLTGNAAMRSVADALKIAGLKMNVFYTSNAERYFIYTQDFIQNLLQMPFEKNGMILRTRQMSVLGLAEPKDYHYNIQNAQNFQHWLETGKIADMTQMLQKRVKTDTTGLSVILEEPEGVKQ